MKYFIAFLGAVALVILILFSIQNAAPVTVWFYNWRFDASLAIVVFLSALAGIVIEALFLVSLRLRRSMKGRARKPLKGTESGASTPEEEAPKAP